MHSILVGKSVGKDLVEDLGLGGMVILECLLRR
jgi:hypothetical protein